MKHETLSGGTKWVELNGWSYQVKQDLVFFIGKTSET